MCGSDTPISPMPIDDGLYELAESIVGFHDDIVRSRGFETDVPEVLRCERTERVLSVLDPVFSTMFGQHPSERYDDVFHQIAVFSEHLAKDHIFPDGKKRTTVSSAISLLFRAGFSLDMDDVDCPDGNELYQWVQDLVSGLRSVDELAEKLRDCAYRIDG